MQYFSEQGPTYQEVLNKIRFKYGEKARIMSHRTIMIGGFLGLFAREGIEISGYIAQEALKKEVQKLDEEKKKILEAAQSHKEDKDEAAKVKEETMNTVLKEVRDLKSSLQSAQSYEDLHPNLIKARKLLERNDFTPSYINEIILRFKREYSVEALEDWIEVQKSLLRWIGHSIKVWDGQKEGHAKTFILVGPTGVGKTTTIAKLAAMHSLDTKREIKLKVRIITIDNYRIGAKQQIATYGEIMGIPTSCVESYSELKKTMALSDGFNLILIDTIGKSPRIATHLAEMRDLLEACGPDTETHLAISSTTKTSDIEEIMGQFEPFRYKSVVLTKMDETTKIGNIISILKEKQKSLSFITNGQRVPQDIFMATVGKLLSALVGFEISPDSFEGLLEENYNTMWS